MLGVEGSPTLLGRKVPFANAILCPLVRSTVFQSRVSSSDFSASPVTGFFITQSISLNACGSVAWLSIHFTCCMRIRCRAVVLKLNCTFETSDMFLRLSVSRCLLTSTFNYVRGKVSLSLDISLMTIKPNLKLLPWNKLLFFMLGSLNFHLHFRIHLSTFTEVLSEFWLAVYHL